MGCIAFGIYVLIAEANDVNLSGTLKFYTALDFFASFVPSPIPIFIGLNYAFSLARLLCKNIGGTSLVKIVAGAELKVICFDKTGTITEP